MDSTKHSPILGYAFDGFPIYGPYAYASAGGSGAIVRMTSSYRLRTISQRTTLSDGTALSPSQYGPDVSTTYPLGLYAEDYEYVNGLGTLDRYNGRKCITPEYPDSIYAYFVTINADGSSAYPYYIGPQYYGVVVSENISSQAHVTVTEAVTVYSPATDVSSHHEIPYRFMLAQNYPNPFNPSTVIQYQLPASSHVTMKVYDIRGSEVLTLVDDMQEAGPHRAELDASKLPSGVYIYRLTSGSFSDSKKLTVLK